MSGEFSPISAETIIGNRRRRKESKYLKLLEEDPLLREKIQEAMKLLIQNKVNLPALHITSPEIELTNGERVSSGFIENMRQNDYRSKDTNVSIFVERNNQVTPAKPEYFLLNPQSLLRDIEIKLLRYLHHGLRTNKSILNNEHHEGQGRAAMLLIEITDTQLERATDYDDHYTLSESVPFDKTVGIVDLNDSGNIHDNLTKYTMRIIDELLAYYKAEEE